MRQDFAKDGIVVMHCCSTTWPLTEGYFNFKIDCITVAYRLRRSVLLCVDAHPWLRIHHIPDIPDIIQRSRAFRELPSSGVEFPEYRLRGNQCLRGVDLNFAVKVKSKVTCVIEHGPLSGWQCMTCSHV